jgi:hypothetical protein
VCASIQPYPDLTQPQTAFPSYEQPEVSGWLIARMHNMMGRSRSMGEIVYR